MKRRIASALLLTALLTACAAPVAEEPLATPTVTPTETVAPTPTAEPTPATEEPETLWGFPIDDLHDAFEVPTGGRLGTVLVTEETMMEDEEGKIKLSVWTADDLTQPIQTIIHAGSEVDRIVDINFDGYMDFGVMYFDSGYHWYSYFWRWDEEQGQFVAEPALDDLDRVEFDKDKQVVYGNRMTDLFGSGSYTVHKWIDGNLVCVREILVNIGNPALVTNSVQVKDLINGEMQEVFYKETYEQEEEKNKWLDLAYHGEP